MPTNDIVSRFASTRIRRVLTYLSQEIDSNEGRDCGLRGGTDNIRLGLRNCNAFIAGKCHKELEKANDGGVVEFSG
jgi:hypothetical protein